jgi:hypothetical protein
LADNKTRAGFLDTYTLAIVVEEGLELYNVGMSDDSHDLELSVLG